MRRLRIGMGMTRSSAQVGGSPKRSCTNFHTSAQESCERVDAAWLRSMSTAALSAVLNSVPCRRRMAANSPNWPYVTLHMTGAGC